MDLFAESQNKSALIQKLKPMASEADTLYLGEENKPDIRGKKISQLTINVATPVNRAVSGNFQDFETLSCVSVRNARPESENRFILKKKL